MPILQLKKSNLLWQQLAFLAAFIVGKFDSAVQRQNLHLRLAASCVQCRWAAVLQGLSAVKYVFCLLAPPGAVDMTLVYQGQQYTGGGGGAGTEQFLDVFTRDSFLRLDKF